MPKQNFKLDSALYPQDRVLETIQAFSAYDITLNGDILMIDDDYPQELFDEFANYCTALSNESLS